MKVGHVTERQADAVGSTVLDTDEMDRAGVELGATGRLQLMAKLAEGECILKTKGRIVFNVPCRKCDLLACTEL